MVLSCSELVTQHGQVLFLSSKESPARQGVYGSAEKPLLHSFEVKNKILCAFTISRLPNPGGLSIIGHE